MRLRDTLKSPEALNPNGPSPFAPAPGAGSHVITADPTGLPTKTDVAAGPLAAAPLAALAFERLTAARDSMRAQSDATYDTVRGLHNDAQDAKGLAQSLRANYEAEIGSVDEAGMLAAERDWARRQGATDAARAEQKQLNARLRSVDEAYGAAFKFLAKARASYKDSQAKLTGPHTLDKLREAIITTAADIKAVEAAPQPLQSAIAQLTARHNRLAAEGTGHLAQTNRRFRVALSLAPGQVIISERSNRNECIREN